MGFQDETVLTFKDYIKNSLKEYKKKFRRPINNRI